MAGSAGKAVCLAGRAQQTRYTVIDDSSHTIAVTGNHRQPALLSLENGHAESLIDRRPYEYIACGQEFLEGFR